MHLCKINCCLTTLQFSYFWELVIGVQYEGKATKVFASIFFLSQNTRVLIDKKDEHKATKMFAWKVFHFNTSF